MDEDELYGQSMEAQKWLKIFFRGLIIEWQRNFGRPLLGPPSVETIIRAVKELLEEQKNKGEGE